MIARTYCGCFNMAMNIKAEIKKLSLQKKKNEVFISCNSQQLGKWSYRSVNSHKNGKGACKICRKLGMRA